MSGKWNTLQWADTFGVTVVEQTDMASHEVVDYVIRALLNELTIERFDPIADQIIAWANESENEHDGRTLIEVIRLVYEQATNDLTRSETYARLCRRMMEQISPKVQDEGIKNAEGKPIAGGQLFRKYLLNRCQEDFEHGWAAKESAAAAAATKATEDQAAKDAAEKDESGEVALYSEEYYIAQKAKRQGLGLVKFIGELFKLQMLTERIMHECVKKLLGTVEKPEKEEIESLCMLLTTVGQLLDTPKARAHMDVYFTRMKELTKNPNVNPRMQFMLVELIELRERKWIPRNLAAAPTTIAAVHAQATKETAVTWKDYGWPLARITPSRVPPKAGDFDNFGKISKSNSMTFGPTGVFVSKDKTTRDSTSSLLRGSSNMFSKLMENPELAAKAAAAQTSRPPSHKDSVDFPSASAPEVPLQHKKLQLLPRPKPKLDERTDSTPAQSEAGHSGDEHSTAPSMSEEEAKTRVDEDSKEFFSIRDLNEAELYFSKLPSEHRWLLVDKLVTSVIESKASDAQLVADFFSGAVSKNLCSPESLEKGFTPMVEVLDDIVIDAPKALDLMATMMKGAHFNEERRARLASKTLDGDKFISPILWTPSLSPSSVSTLSPSQSSSFRSPSHDVDFTFGHNDVSPLGIPSFTADKEPSLQRISASLAPTASLFYPASTTQLRPVRNTRAQSQSTDVFTRGKDPMLSLQETSRPPQSLCASGSRAANPGVGLASLPEVSQLRAHPHVLPKFAAKAVQSELQIDDEDDEDPDVFSMSEEQVKAQLTASMQNFFEVRSLAKGEAALRRLPSAHRWRFINKLVSYAVFSGAGDSRLVSDLFSCAASKGLCSPDEFDEGFSSTMETLDVLALWLPNALSMVAILLKGTRLNEKQLRRLVHKAASSHSEILLALLL
ncbi:armadillo-type protein [Rhodofomes roseus]|uniref:Armadillo-type protein n=1 Tax=Rhodofomes roseus TaxID=34475 RepID=A0ABQ8K9N4_9APHY|nr:armadillo-type protein [Rhodofomes roseus]KAH9834092.1 armadillo-type protein [Rhodofomes roseus]